VPAKVHILHPGPWQSLAAGWAAKRTAASA